MEEAFVGTQLLRRRGLNSVRQLDELGGRPTSGGTPRAGCRHAAGRAWLLIEILKGWFAVLDYVMTERRCTTSDQALGGENRAMRRAQPVPSVEASPRGQ